MSIKQVFNAAEVCTSLGPVTIKPGHKFNTGADKANETKHICDSIRTLDTNGQVYIRSSIMQKKFGRWTRENGVLPVEKQDDPSLHEALTFFEDQVNKSLGATVRSVYTNGDTAWLKTSEDFDALDWDGKKLATPFKYGTGQYQLIIRATQLYKGIHGATPFKHSVLFRVCQLRYMETAPISMFEVETSTLPKVASVPPKKRKMETVADTE